MALALAVAMRHVRMKRGSLALSLARSRTKSPAQQVQPTESAVGGWAVVCRKSIPDDLGLPSAAAKVMHH